MQKEKTPEDAIADTLKAGIDVECGDYLTKHAKSAVLQNKVPISQNRPRPSQFILHSN
jgi:hypothetical protein